MLNLVRVPIDTNKLARWGAERGWARHRGRNVAFDEGRALHHLVHEALGPGVFRSFRFFVPPRRTNGNLYAYSALDSGALRAAAENHALPDHLKVLPPDQIESKPMPESWRAGQRLGFDLRVRPIRRLASPSGNFSKGKEIDVFLADALRKRPATTAKEAATESRTREVVYLDWLTERLAPAAKLAPSSSRLTRFRRVRVARGDRAPEGPDATIHGTLVVADPAAFSALLARGVGRHRAYGYGMLLLRPPNRPAPKQ